MNDHPPSPYLGDILAILLFVSFTIVVFIIFNFLIYNLNIMSTEPGGDPFDLPINTTGVERITIAHGKSIDGIQLHYRDGTETDWVGGKGGTKETFAIASDDEIIRIHVHTGRVVCFIQFETKLGMVHQFGSGKSSNFGIGNIGKKVENDIVLHHPDPPYQNGQWNGGLCGMSGRSGRLIDQIYFKWATQHQHAENDQELFTLSVSGIKKDDVKTNTEVRREKKAKAKTINVEATSKNEDNSEWWD